MKWAKKATIWSKMAKNAYFVPNLAVLGPKFLILMRRSKSFGTHATEKPSRYLVRIVFWSGMGPNWPKMSIFDQKKANFGSNLAVYGPKILISLREGKSFGSHITKKPPRQLVRVVFGRALDQMG